VSPNQVDVLFSHADVEGLERINVDDVVRAGLAVADSRGGSSRGGSRPLTGESGQSGEPWAQARVTRTPILPTDHYNVKRWTDKVLGPNSTLDPASRG
jgi:hypothetical protein